MPSFLSGATSESTPRVSSDASFRGASASSAIEYPVFRDRKLFLFWFALVGGKHIRVIPDLST